MIWSSFLFIHCYAILLTTITSFLEPKIGMCWISAECKRLKAAWFVFYSI